MDLEVCAAEKNESQHPRSSSHQDSSNSRCSTRLLAIAFCVAVALLIVIFILLWILVPRSAAPSSTALCSTESCIAASAMLLHNVNLSADPCHDFFNFACGGFQQRSPFTADTVKTGLWVIFEEIQMLKGKVFELLYKPQLARSDDPELDQMFNATRDIFMSCIRWYQPGSSILHNNTDSLWKPSSSLAAFSLTNLASPIIQQIDSRPNNVEEYIAMLSKTGLSGLIRLAQNVKINDTSYSYELRLKGPVLSFDTLAFYFNATWEKRFTFSIQKFCFVMNITPTEHFTIPLIQTQNQLFNESRTDTFVGNLDELQRRTNDLLSKTRFNWSNFIRHLSDDIDTPKLTIVVGNLEGFTRVLQQFILEYKMKKGPVYDFVRVDAALSLRNFLSDEFIDLKKSYIRQKHLINPEEGGREMDSFSGVCQTMAAEAMNPVTFRMFKNAYQVPDNFKLIETLFENIEQSMMQNVDESTWMLTKSKKSIETKMKDIEQTISYSEIPLTEMKKIYKSAMTKFSAAQNFGEIVLMYKEGQFSLTLWSLTCDRPAHFVDTAISNPLQVTAYYDSALNSVTLPIGIISTYLYRNDYPKYLLYGGIGHVIGHEIGHAFDPDVIRRSNEDGKSLNTLFDAESSKEYSRRSECLVDFYSKMMLAPGTPVNGSKTIGDNFADIVGINAAFRAYKSDVQRSRQIEPSLPGFSLSPEMLFFVQAAQFQCKKMTDEVLRDKYGPDAHSPPAPRTIGMVSQSKEFSRVFGCKSGSRMYLSDKDKCNFW